ncbi:MAG TPA: hypothetical protein VNA29_01005 [Sphingomicrobium sp.]|nr:hypothetical protein [Sphingomicrobium sp.]
MDWTKPHPLERLVEWAAPALLASAAAWAAWTLFATVAAASAALLVAMGLGIAVMKLLAGDGVGPSVLRFEALDFSDCVNSDELLLDDPLAALDGNSRVVHLFAPVEQAQMDPTPGELVTRIADYLGGSRRSALVREPVPAIQADASGALHAALANIRATLR